MRDRRPRRQRPAAAPAARRDDLSEAAAWIGEPDPAGIDRLVEALADLAARRHLAAQESAP